MSNLLNISVKKLLSLSELEFTHYHTKLKYLKPVGKLQDKDAKPFGELTFGQVISIKRNIGDANHLAKIFESVFDISESSLMKIKVIEFYESFNWIVQSLTELLQREKEHLSSDPDPKWDEAGIDRLSIFGDLNTMISIANAYPTISIQEVENLKYSFVFALRLHQKVSGEIEKTYGDILKRERP